MAPAGADGRGEAELEADENSEVPSEGTVEEQPQQQQQPQQENTRDATARVENTTSARGGGNGDDDDAAEPVGLSELMGGGFGEEDGDGDGDGVDDMPAPTTDTAADTGAPAPTGGEAPTPDAQPDAQADDATAAVDPAPAADPSPTSSDVPREEAGSPAAPVEPVAAEAGADETNADEEEKDDGVTAAPTVEADAAPATANDIVTEPDAAAAGADETTASTEPPPPAANTQDAPETHGDSGAREGAKGGAEEDAASGTENGTAAAAAEHTEPVEGTGEEGSAQHEEEAERRTSTPVAKEGTEAEDDPPMAAEEEVRGDHGDEDEHDHDHDDDDASSELGPNDDGPAPARVVVVPPKQSQPQAQPPRMPVPYVPPAKPATPPTASASASGSTGRGTASHPSSAGSSSRRSASTIGGNSRARRGKNKGKRPKPPTSTVVINGVPTQYRATYANDEQLWKDVIKTKLEAVDGMEDVAGQGNLSATEMRILRGKVACMRVKRGVQQKGDGREGYSPNYTATTAGGSSARGANATAVAGTPFRPMPPSTVGGSRRSGTATPSRPHPPPVPPEERTREREVDAIIKEMEMIRDRQNDVKHEIALLEQEAAELRQEVDDAKASGADEYELLELAEALQRKYLKICSAQSHQDAPAVAVIIQEMRRLRAEQGAERAKRQQQSSQRRTHATRSPSSHPSDAASHASAYTYTTANQAALLEVRTLYDSEKLWDPKALYEAFDVDADGFVGAEDLTACMHALTSEFWTKHHVHKLLSLMGCGDLGLGLTEAEIVAGNGVGVVHDLVESARSVSIGRVREKQRRMEKHEAARRSETRRLEERVDHLQRRLAGLSREVNGTGGADSHHTTTPYAGSTHTSTPSTATGMRSASGKRSLVERRLLETLLRNDLMHDLLQARGELRAVERGGGDGATMLTPNEEQALRTHDCLTKQHQIAKDTERQYRFANTSPPRAAAVLERFARKERARAERKAAATGSTVGTATPSQTSAGMPDGAGGGAGPAPSPPPPVLRYPYKLCMVSADFPDVDAVYTYHPDHLPLTTWVSSTTPHKIVYDPAHAGRWVVEAKDGSVVCEAAGHSLDALVWDEGRSTQTILLDAARRKEHNLTTSSLKTLYARYPACSSVYRLCPTPASKASDPLHRALNKAHRFAMVQPENIRVYEPPYAPFT